MFGNAWLHPLSYHWIFFGSKRRRRWLLDWNVCYSDIYICILFSVVASVVVVCRIAYCFLKTTDGLAWRSIYGWDRKQGRSTWNHNAVCSTSADESHSQTWTACFPGTSPSNVPLTQVLLLLLLSECRATAKAGEEFLFCLDAYVVGASSVGLGPPCWYSKSALIWVSSSLSPLSPPDRSAIIF